jgi:NAD(P)-dependent dehydrogenase (short-subunit alcohol dehydrogenase family)
MTKTILISGASGNLGKDVVQTLHEDNYQLSLAVDAHLKDVYLHLPNTYSEVVDLLDEAASAAFVQNSMNTFTSIDAGIFLVGAFTAGDILTAGNDDIKKMMGVNFFTALNLVRPMLSQFQKQGYGKFIFIGAKAGLLPSIGKDYFAYALSKNSIFQLAALINADFAFPNITASVIVPGTMDTPATRASMPDADFTNWVSTKHVAENIAFLLSAAGNNLRETVLKVYNLS